MSLSSLCEESTFSEVFRTYSQRLFRYLSYQTGDQALAEDLTQEAFTRMWTHCKGVKVETAQGYVFQTANNLLRNHHAHQQVVLRFQQHPQRAQDEEHPQHVLETQEVKKQLEDAIAALPEKQRVVFLLSRIERQTYQEIADMLGISRQAVEKRMYKALDSLRDVVKGIP